MIKIINLEGKILFVDDEYILSIRSVIEGYKDDDGKVPYDLYEDIKILDSDGFELDTVSINFKPIELGKKIYATTTLTLDNKSQADEISSIRLLNKSTKVYKLDINIEKTYNFKDLISSYDSPKWITELAAKLTTDEDDIVVSIKASICPQPNESFYTRKKFYEDIKLLDIDGFELTNVSIYFDNTKANNVTSSTARQSFNDLSLHKKIKYLQLLDSIVSINSPLGKKVESATENKISSSFMKEERPKIYSPSNIQNKSSCSVCSANTPLGVNICDKCRSEKLKKIHGTTESFETSKKPISHCEKCQCEVPLGAKICDSCRSQHLKKIHSGEKSKSQPVSIAHTRTPVSEWKPWPPKTPLDVSQVEESSEKIGITGWIIIIAITLFLINACFG